MNMDMDMDKSSGSMLNASPIAPKSLKKSYVLSIDVGVKNLAMCLLSVDKTTKHVDSTQIHFWKWYDVTSVASTAPTTKTCKRGGKGKGNEEMGEMGTCVNVLRKAGNPKCGKPGRLNTRGRAYCGIHDPAKKHKPEDTQEWCYAMINALPGIGKEIDECMSSSSLSTTDLLVVIEQQSVDNKKIMMQSHLIYGFFVSRYENAVPVRFVPAYNKLLVYDGPLIECALKTKYAVRKFTGRKHTEYFLSHVPALAKWKEFYHGCKTKQDDIADAFLQGLYVLIGKPKAQPGQGNDDEDTPVAKQGGARRRRKIRF